MIELAQKVAVYLEPLSVPLMMVIAFGVWKVERRVLALEISLRSKEQSHAVEKFAISSTPATRGRFGLSRTKRAAESATVAENENGVA